MNYRSNVHTMRPQYADFDSPAKFSAIQDIIAGKLYRNYRFLQVCTLGILHLTL